MWKRPAALFPALALLAMTAALPAFAAEPPDTFYLGADGFPQGSLATAVHGGEMPNFDPGRDIHPGLLLRRTDRGLNEADDAGYQHWQIDMKEKAVGGYPTVVIWASTANFDPGRSGLFDVYLLDCPSFGQRCDELGKQRISVDRGAATDWVATSTTFPAIEHQFGPDRFLALRIVVPAESETDMMFAFGFPHQRSRLTFSQSPPVSTTVAAVPSPTSAGMGGRPGPFMSTVVELESGALTPTSTPAAGVAPWLVTMVVTTGLLALFSLAMLTKLGSEPGEPAMVLAANVRQMAPSPSEAGAAQHR